MATNTETVVASTDDTKLVLAPKSDADVKITEAGERGPKSSLEGGEGSLAYAEATKGSGQVFSVQVHDGAHGLRVQYYPGDNGDEAANRALAANKYRGTSIRGVTPASDPDANSMGGERDAAIMFANGTSSGNVINTLGTDANVEATKKLAVADVSELGE